MKTCETCPNLIDGRAKNARFCMACYRKRERANRAGNLYQMAAARFVEIAIRHGDLPKLDGSVKCVDCGGIAKEYDHRDYLFPLVVEPVCKSCNAVRGPALNKHPKGEKRPTIVQRFAAKKAA